MDEGTDPGAVVSLPDHHRSFAEMTDPERRSAVGSINHGTTQHLFLGDANVPSPKALAYAASSTGVNLKDRGFQYGLSASSNCAILSSPFSSSTGPMSPRCCFAPRCRCRLPLSIGFIVPLVAVAAVFFSVTWVTLDKTVVKSITKVSERVNDLTVLHGLLSVGRLLHSIHFATSVAYAAYEASLGDIVPVERFLGQLLSSPSMAESGPEAVMIGQAAGRAMVYGRSTTGEWQIGERWYQCGRFVNFNCYEEEIALYSRDNQTYISNHYLGDFSFPFHNQSWYQSVFETGQAAFTSQCAHPFTGAMGICLSLPLFDPEDASRIDGVLATFYPMDSVLSTFFEESSVFQNTSLMLLLDFDGTVLASSESVFSHESLSERDIQAILNTPLNNGKNMARVSLSSLGDSVVIQVPLDSYNHQNIPESTLPVGLAWRYVIITPERAYYSSLEDQKRTELILIVSCSVSCVIIIVVLVRYTLILPLRGLRHQLVAVRDMVSCRQDVSIMAEMQQMPSKFSAFWFSDLSQLHDEVLSVVRAANEAGMLRANELADSQVKEREHEEVQRTMRAKDIFFASMSHEMRTPLTACIGMAEVLLATPLNDRQKECVDAIALSGGAMLQLVNDILDFSKLQAEKLELENVSFDVRECIEHSVQVVQLKADEKDLELITMIKSDVPATAVGDSARLRQVLFNLLSNAVKFTSKGYVLVKCSLQQTRLLFEIQDTGIGLSRSAISKLFKPFVQADRSTNRHFGGTGLGLVISKRIVQLMDGVLLAHSDGEGRGSTFSFSIPVISTHFPSATIATARRTQHEGQPQTSSPGIIRPVSSIVCSVSPHSAIFSAAQANRFTLHLIDAIYPRSSALCELFHFMRLQYYAHQDLGQLNKIDPQNCCPVQLVIAYYKDYLMPISDLLSTFRAECPPAVRRYVLVITKMKNAFSDSPSDGLMCMSKPVTLQKLHLAITKFMTLAFGEAAPRKTSADASNSAAEVYPESCNLTPIPAFSNTLKRVLVVDDVILTQRVLTLKLEQGGFTHIDCVSSGPEAMRQISTMPFCYDVIFMDINMPGGMDGYETTRAIKADERYASVPIIGLTGNCQASDVQDCLDAGMVSALAKPINTSLLFALLNDVFGGGATTRSSSSTLFRGYNPTSTCSSAATGGVMPMPAISGLDAQAFVTSSSTSTLTQQQLQGSPHSIGVGACAVAEDPGLKGAGHRSSNTHPFSVGTPDTEHSHDHSV